MFARVPVLHVLAASFALGLWIGPSGGFLAALLGLAGLLAVALGLRAPLSMVALALAAGAVATALRPPPSETVLETLPDGEGVVEGWIAEAPELGKEREVQTLEIVASARGPLGTFGPAGGRARVFIARGRDARLAPPRCGLPGDRVRLWSKLHRPDPPRFLGDRDGLAQATIQGVALIGSASGPERCKVMIAGERRGLREAILLRRERVRAAIFGLLEPEPAALVAAFAIGDRAGVEASLLADFGSSGLLHLMAVSGLNLAVVVGALTWLARRLLSLSPLSTRAFGPARGAALVGLLAAGLYTALVGAPASAVRAAWMVAYVLLAALVRRRATLGGAIAFGVLSAAALEPRILSDVSFQLSLAAVMGLSWLGRPFEPWLRARPPLVSLVFRTLLATPLATLATLPITARAFGTVSLIGLLSNVPAAPLGGVALVPAALLGGLLAPEWPTLARPLLGLAAWLTSLLAGLASTFAGLPGGAVPVVPPTPLEMLTFWVGLLVLFLGRGWSRPLGALLLGLVLLISMGRQWLPSTKPDVVLTFLPVGQGDGAVLELPDGKVVVIDCGPEEAGARVIAPFLRAKGHRRIDLVVLSHPHGDHTGGLAELAAAFPIGLVLDNGDRREAPPGLAASLAALRVRRPVLGEVLTFGGATLRVLGPTSTASAAKKVNDGSIVLELSAFGRRVLLAGDAEAAEERALVAQGLERVEVLKLGHHGSKTSSTEIFLDALGPRWAIGSLGPRNHFGFPHRPVVERLAARSIPLLRTDELGAIELSITPQEIRVQCALRPGCGVD